MKTFIWMFVFMGLFFGIMLYDLDIKNNGQRNIYNYTSNSFNWSYDIEIREFNSTDTNLEDSFRLRMSNIITKTVDLAGYTIFQILSFSIEFGYEKLSDISSQTIITAFKIILTIMIISLIIPIIVPFLALVYLLFEGLKWLINRFKNER